ncbi:MAG: hypothetical protein SGJ21_12865 [Alphaproteobacteria bacterium]|nr:hypothetical protein [Alphaproteobacteria bacterium]
MFDQGFDLAAVASAAGLGGSAIGGVGALLFFKGFLMRILTSVIVTAVLTGIGFLALLNVLGFEIVPKEPTEAAIVSPQSADNFSVESAPAAPPATEGKRVYAVKSPFRS